MFWHDHALRKAIQILGSQANLARELKVTRVRVNNWLNRDKYIPLEYAIAIEIATKGLVRWYEIAPYANWLVQFSKTAGIKSFELGSLR